MLIAYLFIVMLIAGTSFGIFVIVNTRQIDPPADPSLKLSIDETEKAIKKLQIPL